MHRTAFLIPKPGLVVRDPDTLQALPADGAEIQLTSYWHRRIKAGDVTQGTAPKSKTTKTAPRGQE